MPEVVIQENPIEIPIPLIQERVVEVPKVHTDVLKKQQIAKM